MPELLADTEMEYSRLNISDVLYAIFKHKWKILLTAIGGISAALAVYFFYTPLYESQAKLLVRYVVDRSPIDTVDGNMAKTSNTLAAIASECEILKSADLATTVAEALGPKRLLPDLGDAATVTAAAAEISKGLLVVPGTKTNMIFVSYHNRDPELARVVLDELVNRYFIKHLEVHRSAGAFDFVSQQTDQVKARINQNEDAVRALKDRAGIV